MPDQPEPRPFGLMLRRPGDIPNPDAGWGDPDRVEGIYVAPDFTIRHTDWDAAGSDPRNYVGGENDWALSLPHRCGEWEIATGSLDDVLAEAERLRAELDQAIDALRAETPHEHCWVPRRQQGTPGSPDGVMCCAVTGCRERITLAAGALIGDREDRHWRLRADGTWVEEYSEGHTATWRYLTGECGQLYLIRHADG